MTQKTLNGTNTAIAVNAATNRLTSATYDANGNLTSGNGLSLGLTMTYDLANRMTSATPLSGGAEYYDNAPDNKRIYRKLGSVEEFTLYGARGEKVGVYGLTVTPGYDPGDGSWVYAGMVAAPVRTDVWFGGRLIWEGTNSGTLAAANSTSVFQDRLGTNRENGARFYPYGEEITSATGNDRVKFGTYNRDGFSTLDYADQRYYAASYGRFNTADPYQASAGPGDPGSWNRYAYVQGDPVNHPDRSGLCTENANGGWWDDPGEEMYLYYTGQDFYSSPGGYPGASMFLTAVMSAAGATLNGSAYFYPESSTQGSGESAPLPTCTLTVDYRGLDALNGYNLFGLAHGYLSETDSSFPGVTYIIEGLNLYGLLRGYDGVLGQGNLPSDNPAKDDHAGSISGNQVCGWMAILNSDVSAIDELTRIRYKRFGPNSNSALRFLLQSLPDSSWYKLPSLVGYGSSIGLNGTGAPQTPGRKTAAPVMPVRGSVSQSTN